MSQWKGPFEELYGFALETGAKDTTEQVRSLKEEFARNGTVGGHPLPIASDQADAVFTAIETALLEKAKEVKERKPYSRGLVTSYLAKVF